MMTSHHDSLLCGQTVVVVSHIYRDRFHCFQMLSLYLYTIIIGHKSCNVYSILNKLTFQKELQYYMRNNVFFTKKSKNTTTKQKNQT